MKKIVITTLLLFGLVGLANAQTFYSWRYRDHATDCTALTDGKDKDLCFEVDSEDLYKCEPSAGDCSGAEWKAVSGSTITGTDAQVLFFDGADSPAGEAGFTYDKTNDIINLAGGLDGIGAVDLDYGSEDVTDHTFVSDGGTAIIDGSVSAGASATPSIDFDDSDDAGSIDGSINVNCPTANDCDMTFAVNSGADTETAFLTADTETGGATTLTVNTDGLNYATGITADPCATLGEGAIFYNDTSNYFCYCDGTNDLKMNDNSTACF